jgi:hypothetical protein
MGKRKTVAEKAAEELRASHPNGFDELRIHLTYGRGGTVKARMWHPDGHVLGSAGGGGYDKQGAALGEAIALLFPEELKTLPLPKYDPVTNRREEGALYGLGGNDLPPVRRYIDGACGINCVLRIIKALGYSSVRLLNTGKDSSMVLAEKTPGKWTDV